ncbi:MAG: PAS domain-containing protein [Hyphomicrobiales bacterium]
MHSALDIDADQVRDHLDRILASAEFVDSPRLKDLIEYLVTESLEGRGERLKGYIIGIDVFERGEDFNPDSDTIVRVQAGRLRAKLKTYYLTEGKNDGLRIELPKGTYKPRFKSVPGTRPPPAAVRNALEATASAPPVYHPPADPQDKLWSSRHLAFDRVASLAARLTNAAAALVTVGYEDRIDVLGCHGVNLQTVDTSWSFGPFLGTGTPLVVIDDVMTDPRIPDDHPLRSNQPPIKKVVAVPVVLTPPQPAAVTVIDPDPEIPIDAHLTAMLSDLADLAAAEILALRATADQLTEMRDMQGSGYEIDPTLVEFIDTASFPVAVINRNHRFVYVNEATARLLGVSATKHIGKRPSDVSPVSTSEFEQVMETVFQTGESVTDFEMRGVGGRRLFRAVFLPLPRGAPEPQRLIAALFDETDMRANELALSDHLVYGTGEVTVDTGKAGTAARFLLDSLVRRNALHSRRNVSFVTVRDWRRSLKDQQVLAMSTVRSRPPKWFARQMATEIMQASNELFGADYFSGVTSLPRLSRRHGHRLSFMVAEELTHMMSADYLDLLEPVRSDTSKRGGGSVRYVTKARAPGPTLLVHDTIHTGRLIQVAVDHLRSEGSQVSVMGWVG